MSTKNINRLQEQLEALKRKLSEEKRKIDTRKKILVGSAFLKAVEEQKIKPEVMTSLLNQYIKKPHDREILGLTEINNNSDNTYNHSNNEHQTEYQNHY